MERDVFVIKYWASEVTRRNETHNNAECRTVCFFVFCGETILKKKCASMKTHTKACRIKRFASNETLSSFQSYQDKPNGKTPENNIYVSVPRKMFCFFGWPHFSKVLFFFQCLHFSVGERWMRIAKKKKKMTKMLLIRFLDRLETTLVIKLEKLTRSVRLKQAFFFGRAV